MSLSAGAAWVSALGAAGLPVLVDAAIKGSAILAMACIASVFVRRASAATRHLVWFLALASLLAMPALSWVLPGWQVLPAWVDVARPAAYDAPAPEPPPWAPATGVTEPAPIPDHSSVAGDPPAPPAPVPAMPEKPASVRAAAPSPWSATALGAWLVLVWTLGAAAALVPALLGAMSLWFLARSSRRVTDGPWMALLERLSAGLGLRRRVVLLTSDRRSMPMAWGVRRPRLLLPAEAGRWPPGCLCAVLLHELAHVKRWDCLTQLVMRIACGLYWFNPLAWVALRCAVAEHERACDDVVLAAGGKPSEYAEYLLDVASRLPGGRFTLGVAIALARPSRLEGRLRAILDGTRSRRAVTRAAMLGAILALAAVLVPLAALRGTVKAADERPDARAFAASLLNAVKAGDAEACRALMGDEELARQLAGYAASHDLESLRPETLYASRRELVILSNPVKRKDGSAAEVLCLALVRTQKGWGAGEAAVESPEAAAADLHDLWRRIPDLEPLEVDAAGGRSATAHEAALPSGETGATLDGWGETDHGVRVRLTAVAQEEHRRGFTLPLTAELKNTGNTTLPPIALVGARATVEAKDGSGTPLRVRPLVDVLPWEARIQASSLAAGGSVQWRMWLDQLAFVDRPEAGSTLRVRLRVRNRDFDAPSDWVALTLRDSLPVPLEAEHGAGVTPLAMDLVYRETGGASAAGTPLDPSGAVHAYAGRAVHVDSSGRVTVAVMTGGKDAWLGRHEAALEREDLDRLADFLKRQQVWKLDSVKPEPAGDESMRLSLSSGGRLLDVEFPLDQAAREPTLLALRQEMWALMAKVVARMRDDLKGWGPVDDEGVQSRLRAEKREWPVGQTPTLAADVRNLGMRDLWVAQAQQAWEVAVDGQWYRWTGDTGLKYSPFEPGREYHDIRFALVGPWHSKEGNKPLSLAPGKHAVRVAAVCMTHEESAPMRAMGASNVVEIEVLPNASATAASSSEAHEVAWSEALNGLRVRLTAPSGTIYRQRAALPLLVEVQNVSDKPIPFSKFAPEFRIRATDAKGAWMGIPRRSPELNPWEGRTDGLAPGDTVRWTVWFDRLRFVKPVEQGSSLDLAVSAPTQLVEPGQLPKEVYSPPVTIQIQDEFPSLASETDLTGEWTAAMDLTFWEYMGLMGHRAMHIDGQGRVTMLSRMRGRDDGLMPPGRTEVILDKQRLDRLARLLRDQQVWSVAAVKRDIAYSDEEEIRLSLSIGAATLVGDYPLHVARDQPSLMALRTEMHALVADAVAAARKQSEGSGERPGEAEAGPPTGRLTPEQEKERDQVLAAADQRLRKGLIALGETFPQLKAVHRWNLVAGQSSPGSIIVYLSTVTDESKAREAVDVAEGKRFSLSVNIIPADRVDKQQLKVGILYRNLGLFGMARARADDPKLDAALKKLLDDALSPLKVLDEQVGKGRPAVPAPPATQPTADPVAPTPATLEKWLTGKEVVEVCFAGAHMEPLKLRDSLKTKVADNDWDFCLTPGEGGGANRSFVEVCMRVSPENTRRLLSLQEELEPRGYRLDPEHTHVWSLDGDPNARAKAREMAPGLLAAAANGISTALPKAQSTTERPDRAMYLAGIRYEVPGTDATGMIRINEIAATKRWQLPVIPDQVIHLPRLSLMITAYYRPGRDTTQDASPERAAIRKAVNEAIAPLLKLEGDTALLHEQPLPPTARPSPASGEVVGSDRNPGAGFDTFRVEAKSFWAWNRTLVFRGDGTYTFQMQTLEQVPGEKRVQPSKTSYVASYRLSPGDLEEFARLLKATEWLSLPASPGPVADDATEYAMTLSRGQETARRTYHEADKVQAYVDLTRFLRRVERQEELLFAATHRESPFPGSRDLGDELDGMMGGRNRARPYAPALDYQRLVPAYSEFLSNPRLSPQLAADAAKLMGYLKLESQRRALENLVLGQASGDPSVPVEVRKAAVEALGLMGAAQSLDVLKTAGQADGPVRDAVADALATAPGDKTLPILKNLAGSSQEAAWVLIRQGRAAEPALQEIFAQPGDETVPTGRAAYHVIRAYVDHWKELPGPPSAATVSAVQDRIRLTGNGSLSGRYGLDLLRLADVPFVVPNAWQSVEEFLSMMSDRGQTERQSLFLPKHFTMNPPPERLLENARGGTLKVRAAHVDGMTAWAHVADDRNQVRYALLLGLNGGVLWTIEAARSLPAEKVQEDLDRFLRSHPKAQAITAGKDRIEKASSGRGTEDVRQFAEGLLAAIRDKDLATARRWSAGAVSGWLSPQEAKELPPVPAGWSADRLETAVKEIHEMYAGNPERIRNVRAVEVRGDWAGVHMEGPGDEAGPQPILILQRTAEGWRLADVAEAKGALAQDLEIHATGLGRWQAGLAAHRAKQAKEAARVEKPDGPAAATSPPSAEMSEHPEAAAQAVAGGRSYLRGGDTTDAGLKTYARLKNRAGVEVESISGSKITDVGLRELRDFRNLRALNLTCAGGVTDAGVKELKGCTGLRELRLVNTGVSNAGLAELKGLDALEALYLSGPKITDAGLSVLKEFKGLREVCLLGPTFTDAGLKELKDLKGLRMLHLCSAGMTDAGLRELKGFTGLQVLSLPDTSITDAGLKELKGVKGLRQLNLRYTKVTDIGMRDVAEVKSLQMLDLTYTNVTDAGLKELEGLQGLRELHCVGAAVTEAGVERLRRALPEAKITAGEGAGARPTLEPAAKSGEPDGGAPPAAAAQAAPAPAAASGRPAPDLAAPDEVLKQLATIVELEERILAGVQGRFKTGHASAEDVARQQVKVTDAKVRLAERKAELASPSRAAPTDEIRRLLAETVAREEELLAQVQERYRVGTTTAEEVDRQQVRLAEAKVRLAERMKAAAPPAEKPAGAASKTSEAPPDGWGEAFEGVQCRLRADRIAWKSGDAPTLKADVRNQGTREVHVHMVQEIRWELQVDGDWYVWGRGLPWVGWRTLTPGTGADGISFRLDGSWQRKSDRRPLALTSGRHVVRVGLPIPPDVDPSEPPVPLDQMGRSVSNAVEIEILPDEARPAATPILKIRSTDGAAVADVHDGAVRVRLGEKTVEGPTIIISLDPVAAGTPRRGIALTVRDGAVRMSADGTEALGTVITIHPDGRTEVQSREATEGPLKAPAPAGPDAVRPLELARAEPGNALAAGDGATRADRQVFPLTYREADETDGLVRGNTFHHCLAGRPAQAKAVPADLSGQARYFLLPIGGRKVPAVLDPSPSPRLFVDVAGTGDLAAAGPLPATPWGPLKQFGPVAIPVDGQAGRVARVRFLSSLDKDIAVAPAGYVAGEVNLDGQPYRVALVDHSLSGRYDNVLRGEGDSDSARGETYLAIDLNQDGRLEPPGTDASETFDLLPTLHVRNAYHSVQVTPDGSSIALAKAEPEFGTLDTGCADLSLTLVGEHGLHGLSGSGGKWQIPAGWHVATGATLNERDAAGILWSLHGVSSWGRLARFDMRAGQTLSLRAGPPLSVKVHPSGLQPNGMVHFALALEGQAGENYNAAPRKGGVPQPPRFRVFDEAGKALGSGVFNAGSEGTYSWCWWRVPEGFKGKYRVEVEGDFGPFEIARGELEWFSTR